MQYPSATMPRNLLICIGAMLALISGCRDGQHSSSRSASNYPGAEAFSLRDVGFDDGDTIFINGKSIRILGMDTPETRSPSVGIMIDQPYGPEAADSTRAWLTRATSLQIVRDGKDPFDRQLAHIFVDGELLAVRMLRHGLAYENVSHFGDNGFPDLAQQILEASRRGPKPRFEKPHIWKKKNQRRD